MSGHWSGPGSRTRARIGGGRVSPCISSHAWAPHQSLSACCGCQCQSAIGSSGDTPVVSHLAWKRTCSSSYPKWHNALCTDLCQSLFRRAVNRPPLISFQKRHGCGINTGKCLAPKFKSRSCMESLFTNLYRVSARRKVMIETACESLGMTKMWFAARSLHSEQKKDSTGMLMRCTEENRAALQRLNPTSSLRLRSLMHGLLRWLTVIPCRWLGQKLKDPLVSDSPGSMLVSIPS